MSGHSKWSQIKRKKGVKDAARGKLFTKLIREITVSARQGGADPAGNTRLRLAIQTAKEANMPQDNIARAIKKGTGELDGVSYEEVSYEGYGPGGVALLIDTLTDNKNRTTAEIRRVLTRHSGNLGEAGCVAWNFETKGVIFVPQAGLRRGKAPWIGPRSGGRGRPQRGRRVRRADGSSRFRVGAPCDNRRQDQVRVRGNPKDAEERRQARRR